MTREQLIEVLPKIFLKSSSGGKQKSSTAVDARAVKCSAEEIEATVSGMVHALFKDKKKITFQDVWSVRGMLREDLWHYEFNNFDPDENGTISIDDFLCSIIGFVTGRKVDRYMKQVDKVSLAMPNARVSYHEFIAFQHWLD